MINPTYLPKIYKLPEPIIINNNSYIYIKQDFYQPSGSIKLTLLTKESLKDKSCAITITSDFKQANDYNETNNFILDKTNTKYSDLVNYLEKNEIIQFYRSVFYDTAGRWHTVCKLNPLKLTEVSINL